ncbi:tRNA pseudouridine synthase [Meloidogyne graminicola]|uniref:tRNA pseudouridine synthase n=1 Tax=Meloidogyne graminicola TaxID=189291 RepID=A0A8S9ZIA5_9BILA|nr:tRNA pseudouridine synthase [Meloidogyne graminicola]
MIKRFIRSFLQMINNFSSIESTNALRKRSADETIINEAISPKIQRKPKKVKYAMLLAYQGQNYYGMQFQRNNKFPTIESSLFDAMELNGFINKEHREDLMEWHFQRAARTDRSVSAVGQICSMHLPLDTNFLENGPKLLNSSLPEDIRVFGIKRVFSFNLNTPSFHSQKFCDSRSYSYTLPSFSFASIDELTNSEYRISTKRIEELHELLGCYVGTHNFFNYTSGLEHSDQSARRVILSITTDEPFIYTDPITQLRMDIPKAPGLGLLLERLHYDRFETRFLKTHGSLNNWGEEIEAQLLEFRDRKIMDRILSEECKTQNMFNWLSTLSSHKYITNPEDETGENSINEALQFAAHNAKSTASDTFANDEDNIIGENDDGNEVNEILELNDDLNLEKVEETEFEENRRKSSTAL